MAGFTLTPSIFCQVALDSMYSTQLCGSLNLNYDFTL
jgi:hypothetical protein